MSFYQKIDVNPIINAAGTETRYGGARMDEEVLAAMNEAARDSVKLDELQAAASRIISEKTHAEAGIVTAGASAAMTLATAACLCRYDVSRMNRLPDTARIPNEIVMPWHQISGYSHAFRSAGAFIVGAGIPNDTSPPDEVHVISRYDVETAVTENTTALAYAVRRGSHPPLEDVIAVGQARGIPIIVDAAAQLPPPGNLHRFIDMGADLVCFSGGKGLCGPQASGILCGRKDLIASAALQMLDMAGRPFDEWAPAPDLIPKDELHGKPQHGICRGCKVSKEAIAGLLTALINFTDEGFAEKSAGFNEMLDLVVDRVRGVDGVVARVAGGYPDSFPTLTIHIDRKAVGIGAAEVSERLRRDRIYVRETKKKAGQLGIHPINLDKETASHVADKLRAALEK